MKILLIAPHPFYQERGTPIAVDMLLRALGELGHEVDVYTFPEGENREYSNTSINRAKTIGTVKGIRPGFSFKKLYTDIFLFAAVYRACKSSQYDVIHAIEESGFFALILKLRFRIPYVYDMDSLLSAQLVDSKPKLRILRPLFQWLENKVVRSSVAVAPMCEDLATEASNAGARRVVVLKDVSLIQEQTESEHVTEDLRTTYDIPGAMVMYIGNLEPYQGIDLLFNAFVVVQKQSRDSHLVVIGGGEQHIKEYQKKMKELEKTHNCRLNIHLIGPRPVVSIGDYLKQADILASPRVHGTNTPMKIYSYMHSGIPVVATNLPTHTQVLNSDTAVLVAHNESDYATGLLRLIEDRELRETIGKQAREYAEKEHGYDGFLLSVKSLYSQLQH